jgi:hypothetical protein
MQTEEPPLGSIRHKGIIPWNDDLDVEVGYRDFDKLLSAKVVKEFRDKGYTIKKHIEKLGKGEEYNWGPDWSKVGYMTQDKDHYDLDEPIKVPVKKFVSKKPHVKQLKSEIVKIQKEIRGYC